MEDMESALAELRSELASCIKEHSPRGDSLYHNGGTVVALAATATATLLPASMSVWARAAAAVATFVIAVSRALDFGGRWRWHLQMRNVYRALNDRVVGLAVLPADQRPAAAAKIFEDLASVRALENGIPGAGLPEG
jgi:hypothetical protein